ncbi:protein of unknown function [Cyanobium sp. NIES-981]|nr:protein of unknown function [Cyanobium sp. NIES-981]
MLDNGVPNDSQALAKSGGDPPMAPPQESVRGLGSGGHHMPAWQGAAAAHTGLQRSPCRCR